MTLICVLFQRYRIHNYTTVCHFFCVFVCLCSGLILNLVKQLSDMRIVNVAALFAAGRWVVLVVNLALPYVILCVLMQ